MLNIQHTTLGLIPGNTVALQQVSLQIYLVLHLLNIDAPLLYSHLLEVYNNHDQEAQSNWEGVGGGGLYVSNVAVTWTHTKHKESCPYAYHNGVYREQRDTSNHS